MDDLDALVAGWDKPVEKFYVPFSGPEVCRQAWADLSQLPYFVTGAGFVDLEVMNPATNKGLALAALCRALGVPAEQVMAIGDSGNDAAMLDFAGKAKEYVPNVVMTIVDKDQTPEAIERCRRITRDLGVKLRIRAYIPD